MSDDKKPTFHAREAARAAEREAYERSQERVTISPVDALKRVRREEGAVLGRPGLADLAPELAASLTAAPSNSWGTGPVPTNTDEGARRDDTGEQGTVQVAEVPAPTEASALNSAAVPTEPSAPPPETPLPGNFPRRGVLIEKDLGTLEKVRAVGDAELLKLLGGDEDALAKVRKAATPKPAPEGGDS